MTKKRESRKLRVAADVHGERRLVVLYRKIAALTLDPKNPRIHSRKQTLQIARSIKAFGFNIPVVIDPQGQVIAGHGRILAALELGWHEVPTICLTHLTAAQTRAFAIADNKLTENAMWDERLLAQQFKDLAAVDLDFTLEATGFEMGEIDMLIEGLAPAPQGEDDPADAVPELSSGLPVSQAGDLWLLGPHRVYCGNALEDAAYVALMGDGLATMVFTDPPYNVPIEGHASGLGRVKHKDFLMASGEMSEAEFTAFLLKTCTLLGRYSVDGSVHFIFIDWRHVGELLAAGRLAYAELKNLCVWDKGTGGMGSLHRSGHELILVFKRGQSPHRNNVQLGQFGRNRSNIWRHPGVNSFARSTEEGNLLALHPTVKPVALVADALLDCSSRGDIVLYAFLGSGTTVIAAERTGRICYGIELDPNYVDTAIRRWQQWTSQQARQAITGTLFNQLNAEKGNRHVE